MPAVTLHREEISLNIGDPFMELVKEPTLLNMINRAARDLSNSGWLVPNENAENIELLTNEYEYDVPARFAYIEMIRLGDQTRGIAETVATGILLDEGSDITSSQTSFTVDDGSIFVINDLIQLDTEVMFITAIVVNSLTVTRGYASTTAAAHLNNVSIDRPNASTVYDYVIPRAYWHMKIQSGGANTTTAALASRPQIVFHSSFFSYTAGTHLQIVGQRRPTSVYSASDTLDSQMESFIVERATAYAARFIFAQGDAPHLDQVYRESMATSAAFLTRHPQEFRVHPNSTRVPGR